MPTGQQRQDVGYEIRPASGASIVYEFNMVMGESSQHMINEEIHEHRNELETFGKYPAINYVGNTHYKKFPLKTVFTTKIRVEDEIPAEGGGEQFPPMHGPIVVSAYEEYERFREDIRRHREWIVEGGMKGDIHVCDISITGVELDQNSLAFKSNNPDDIDGCEDRQFMDYVEVTIECTEVRAYTGDK